MTFNVSTVPAIVVRAATLAERDRTGAIVYRIHQTSAMDGGPLHRHADVVIEAAAFGPDLVKVRVLRYLADGAEQSDDKKRDLRSGPTSDGHHRYHIEVIVCPSGSTKPQLVGTKEFTTR